MGVKRETLEGGNVLRALVAQFNNDRTEQNLFALLCCLRDSFIWIPCNAVISNEDAEQFPNAQKGDVIQSMNDIKMEPDILQNGDELFFPIFSNCEQMGEDYGGRFSKVEKHTFEAMNMAMARENVVGLVLDAFTQPFVIKKDLFEIIGKLPTNIDEE